MTKVEEFQTKLELLNETAKEQNKVLREQNFEDESLFEKIKSNVYEIYLKMIKVASNKGDFVKEYPYFFEKIPGAWHEALENAIQNEDFEQEQIERVKLNAKTEIEALFYSIFGG